MAHVGIVPDVANEPILEYLSLNYDTLSLMCFTLSTLHLLAYFPALCQKSRIASFFLFWLIELDC